MDIPSSHCIPLCSNGLLKPACTNCAQYVLTGKMAASPGGLKERCRIHFGYSGMFLCSPKRKEKTENINKTGQKNCPFQMIRKYPEKIQPSVAFSVMVLIMDYIKKIKFILCKFTRITLAAMTIGEYDLGFPVKSDSLLN